MEIRINEHQGEVVELTGTYLQIAGPLWLNGGHRTGWTRGTCRTAGRGWTALDIVQQGQTPDPSLARRVWPIGSRVNEAGAVGTGSLLRGRKCVITMCSKWIVNTGTPHDMPSASKPKNNIELTLFDESDVLHKYLAGTTPIILRYLTESMGRGFGRGCCYWPSSFFAHVIFGKCRCRTCWFRAC